jgi:hypothetical protein
MPRTRKLLRGEAVVTKWMDLTLTTHRVWQYTRDGGNLELTSFSLDDIEWARVGRSHAPWLLWTAAASALFAVVLVEEDRVLIYGLVVLAGLLAFLYATNRRLVIFIGAKRCQLVAYADDDASEESALDFVHQLESCKHARTHSVHRAAL